MLRLQGRILHQLYGKDLIAFGTGIAGKELIPCLVELPDIKLHGVTNSRISAKEEKVFLDTNLPLRNLQAWAEIMPNATILITIYQREQLEEIYDICEAAGFKEAMEITYALRNNIVNAAINMNAVRELNSIAENSELIHLSHLSHPSGNPMLNIIGLANEIHDVHAASFSEFKACHKGQTIAVVATGPTLNYYSQIKNIPHIGVNASFYSKSIEKLDYYFLWHYEAEWFKQLKEYDCIKFFSQNTMYGSDDKIPEYAFEENNARRFFTGNQRQALCVNIEYYPLMAFSSIIFPAIQFAMHTRPKRLLLIGCDCDSNDHFDGDVIDKATTELNVPDWFEGHQMVRVFAQRHYPDMEIISINPVGLKGLYHDVYTESYLDDHPEIDRTKCEIINLLDYEVN